VDDDDDIDKLVYTSEESNNETVRIILSTLGQPQSPTAAPQEQEAAKHQPQAAAPDKAAHVTAKCPPRRVRTVSWPWTAVGTVAEVACPVGTGGTARWACQIAGGSGSSRQSKETAAVTAAWEPAAPTPDLSECQSTWMGRILADLRKSDAVGTIAADLVQYVAANPLYGGDIAATVSAMTIIGEKLEYQLTAIPTMEQREAMVVEVAQSLLRTASSLLDVDSLAAWMDLPPRLRRRTLADFLGALERAGHLLPHAIPADREVSISSQNVCKFSQ
jgi:latrophilin 1